MVFPADSGGKNSGSRTRSTSVPLRVEALTALVVARPGSGLTAEAVTAHCAGRLARFKIPSVIRLVDALPHSATGKVAKGRLREVYQGEVEIGRAHV